MEVMLGLVKCARTVLSFSFRIIAVQNAHYTRLAEVGRLEAPKIQGKYDTGQLFLHRVFGYRGVILFPWLARVYDRDLPSKRERSNINKQMSPFCPLCNKSEEMNEEHLQNCEVLPVGSITEKYWKARALMASMPRPSFR